MPVEKSDDELAEQIIRQQKEQELAARAKELEEEQRRRMEEAKARIRAQGRQQAESEKRTYTVKAGDTLGKIAQALLGDGSRWPEIYEANKDQIADPNLIEVGQELVIP
jgi:nucleoid-associated protein YgaU